MTAFDDDPEYEAQLQDVLSSERTWQNSMSQNAEEIEEMGEFVVNKALEPREERSEDEDDDEGVLDDAPRFRMRMPVKGTDDDGSDNGKAMSEDARSISTGDDSPSVQGSEATLSAQTTPNKLNGYGYLSPIRAFSPSRRFDIRQHQRLSSYSSLGGIMSPGSPAPSSLHSRMSSYSSNIADVTGDITPSDSPHVPWEVVRWTKLRKIEGQAFSEIGKRKFGMPTAMASSGVIAIGTSKGLVLIFDFRQSLKHVIGVGTKAAQSGLVTALALSADHTVLLVGHSSGEIFTWDLSKPAQPHSHTPSLTPEQISSSRRDGHITGTPILHVDFLGLRHGAFVSADGKGMAFVHTLSRKLIVANVSTTRILGRYPEKLGSASRPVKPHKPSCVLGMSGLPLGSVKYVTDEMQLVGMLSPYKLVIVSIIPFPQTQLRVARPKRASPDGSILSGCIAWYPCVKSDSLRNEGKEQSSMKPKIAYTWDRYLAIRQVIEVLPGKEEGKEGPPRLRFPLLNEWMSEETIVAAQWLLQQVLVLLTVTQRLLILDTSTMQVTASCDLLMKQILHHDRFSSHMSNFPAVADAYYHSFKTYKHKIFLLCNEDVSVGSLLTWADRVLALVEAADFIEAINLTSSYYNGKSEKITLGLPEDDDERHAVVQDKLTEMIIASLKYTFSHKEEREDDNAVHSEVAHQKMVKDLTAACIDACMSMQSPSFLFDEVYEVYEEYSQTDIFIEVLEPYILQNRIQDVPPSMMKDVTSYFVGKGLHQRLEQVICHIDPGSLDIDQITGICRTHGLYDAFAYVYNTALKDYISPMVEFVRLVREFFERDHHGDEELIDHHDEKASIAFDAFKVFPYLSYILTGRTYPTGEEMSDSDAHEAKQSLYYFLFSGRTLSWPQSRGTLIRTTPESSEEPTFPYLRLFLRFDAPTLFQAMDEAFEDRFLNGTESNGTTGSFSRTINRQFIINIFLEVMSDDSDIIYLYMFIARNLPKYPQFILLSGTTIEGILLHLCTYGQSDMAEEAQLAAEYLLSVFKPSDSEKMIREYKKAGFWRVLKTTLRAEGRYTELLDVYLRDEDRTEVFECADGLLRAGSSLNAKQREAVKLFLLERLEELVRVNVPRTADIFERYIWDTQKEVIQRLTPQRLILFAYLDAIFSEHLDDVHSWIDKDVRELYISLVCEFRPTELTTFLDTLSIDDFRIENILPTLEKYDVTDAIILVLRRVGMTKEAMHKVVIHMTALQRELLGVMAKHMSDEAESQSDELVAEISQYAFVGADLCETFSKEYTAPASLSKGKAPTGKLNEAEQLWLSLLETTVGITREITSIVSEGTVVNGDLPHESHTLDSLRVVVQDIFTKLLTMTSSTPISGRRSASPISFLSILRAFLRNLASSPITDLRAVLSSIFDAYRYEKSLIQVTSKLIEADLFQDLLSAKKEREKGWRPTSANCLACGRVLFGPGAKGNIFSKWETKRIASEATKLALHENRRRENNISPFPLTPDGKGKGKSVDMLPSLPVDPTNGPEDVEGDVVIFGCGHAFHRGCLTELGSADAGNGAGAGSGNALEEEESGEGEGGMFRCIVCEAH